MHTHRFRALLAVLLSTGALLLAAGRAEAAAAPSVPANLHVTSISPTSVTLAWTASTGDPVDYSLTYWPAFGDVGYSQRVGNVTSATITSGINPNGQIQVTVQAIDADGHSSTASNPLVVVTPAHTTGDMTAPTAPGNLTLTGVSPEGAQLTWTASTDDVELNGYYVYLFDGWFVSRYLGTTTGTSFTAPILSTQTGMVRYYVRARDAAGNLSIASNQVSTPATPPTAPCTVTYKTTSEWPGGFVAEVKLSNTATTPVNGWSLAVSLGGDQHVTSSWAARWAQSGSTATLTNETWNATISPGADITVGLVGTYTKSNASATAAALNGTSCTLA
ncbi:cellulose binding domain-containing protein [Actinoplanes sp. N902-109]|uniref:cellulose binding domain-containing protein n=1 Tax=Actinoplanes sp. (strain N902-109) TaxID=649831 RepID=UPI000329579B|nr:cellulose binding domain-containing protein [Actinoplanes sp. N902-109]AGL19755.1 cellulose-binding family II protein [Actinoplanes sp. N902-109]